LQLRALARTDRATTAGDQLTIAYNSDFTAADYADHGLVGDGSSASAYSVVGGLTSGALGFVASGSYTSSAFGACVWDILDYTNTNKYKTDRCLSGADSNGFGQIRLTSGLWMKTNAITTITIGSGNSATLQQYSSFALYGVK
jgi:hypothetical protein